MGCLESNAATKLNVNFLFSSQLLSPNQPQQHHISREYITLKQHCKSNCFRPSTSVRGFIAFSVLPLCQSPVTFQSQSQYHTSSQKHYSSNEMPTTRSQAQQKSLQIAAKAAVSKPTIAIIGTGWAGWTLLHELDDSKFDIVVLSRERTLALTPLLASAACGIFDFRNAEEPVRRRGQVIRKYQAEVQSIDFEGKILECKSSIGDIVEIGQEDTDGQERFGVEFDKLVIAPGCEVNTFGTPGVKENAFFLKTTQDAMLVRARILDLFERASLPTLSEEQRRNTLRVVVVGGGPTGVAIAAEIDDLVSDHLFEIYPHLSGEVSLDIYDVAPKILAPFDEKLGEHALQSFGKRNVGIKTDKHIEKVEKDRMHVKEDGEVKYGMLIWATGNKSSPLCEELEGVQKQEKTLRLLTDSRLRVKREDGTVMDNVFSLGDAADIEGSELPTTAEVAVQKAKWLARHLNASLDEMGDESGKPFDYEQKALIAYIGGGDGVIAGKKEWTGTSAWVAWRSGTLQWSRSWRRRFMIVMNWAMNYIDGREIARKN